MPVQNRTDNLQIHCFRRKSTSSCWIYQHQARHQEFLFGVWMNYLSNLACDTKISGGLFWDKVCWPGWPWPCNPSASIFKLLKLQVYLTMSGFKNLVLRYKRKPFIQPLYPCKYHQEKQGSSMHSEKGDGRGLALDLQVGSSFPPSAPVTKPSWTPGIRLWMESCILQSTLGNNSLVETARMGDFSGLGYIQNAQGDEDHPPHHSFTWLLWGPQDHSIHDSPPKNVDICPRGTSPRTRAWIELSYLGTLASATVNSPENGLVWVCMDTDIGNKTSLANRKVTSQRKWALQRALDYNRKGRAVSISSFDFLTSILKTPSPCRHWQHLCATELPELFPLQS